MTSRGFEAPSCVQWGEPSPRRVSDQRIERCKGGSYKYIWRKIMKSIPSRGKEYVEMAWDLPEKQQATQCNRSKGERGEVCTSERQMGLNTKGMIRPYLWLGFLLRSIFWYTIGYSVEETLWELQIQNTYWRQGWQNFSQDGKWKKHMSSSSYTMGKWLMEKIREKSRTGYQLWILSWTC